MLIRRMGPSPPPGALIEQVVPALVPVGYFEGTPWTPFRLLPAAGVALTWVMLRDLPAFLAVAQTAAWEQQGIDWQARALANLAALSADPPVTAAHRDEQGRLRYAVMAQPDGLGGSRLLLRDRLAALFPEGYRAAVPAMSCGIVVSATVDETGLREAMTAARQAHATAEAPLSAEFLDPEELE